MAINPKTIINSYKPASSARCPEKYGVANVYGNKLQGTACKYCKDILDDAKLTYNQSGIR